MFILLSGAASTPTPFDWATFIEWIVGILVAGVLAYFPLSKWAKPVPNLHVEWALTTRLDEGVSPFSAHRQIWFELHNFSETPAFNVTANLLTPEWQDTLIDWKNPFGKDDVIRALLGTHDMTTGTDSHGNTTNVMKDTNAAPVVPSVRVTWLDSKHGAKLQTKDFTCPKDVS